MSVMVSDVIKVFWNAEVPIDVTVFGITRVPASVGVPDKNALSPIVAQLLPDVNARAVRFVSWKALMAMDTTCVGMVIRPVVSVLMPANANRPIVSLFPCKPGVMPMSVMVSDVITVLWNAVIPIDVTVFGITRAPASVGDANDVNALAPIIAQWLPVVNTRLVRFVSWKALMPMDTTCVGMVIRPVVSVLMPVNAASPIVSLFAAKAGVVLMSVMVSDVIKVFWNAKALIDVTVFGIIRAPASVGDANALSLIVAQWLPSVNTRLVRFVSWKALVPMDTTCVGMVIVLLPVVSVLMLANALAPIVSEFVPCTNGVVLISVMVSDVIAVPWNAEAPIDVTLYVLPAFVAVKGMMTAGITTSEKPVNVHVRGAVSEVMV